MNKYTDNSSERCFLEVDLKYLKELWELPIDYLSPPGKVEMKREVLPEYQLKIADFYNIPITNVKKLVSSAFDKDKYLIYYKNIQLYLMLKTGKHWKPG